MATDTLGKIAVIPRPAAGSDLLDSLHELKISGADILVSMLGPKEADWLGLAEEEAMCSRAGLTFLCLPIVDRSTPSDIETVKQMAMVINAALEGGQNVAVHCQMGIGRSSLMVACVLAAQGMDVEDAFDRISIARGREVPDTMEQRQWVVEFAKGFK